MPAPWQPPVTAKRGCIARIDSTARVIAAGVIAASDATGVHRASRSSTVRRPHTPQAEVTIVPRRTRSSGSTRREPGAGVTSRVLP